MTAHYRVSVAAFVLAIALTIIGMSYCAPWSVEGWRVFVAGSAVALLAAFFVCETVRL